MKKVFTSTDLAQIKLMQAVLIKEGIDTVTMNEELSNIRPAAGYANTWPELWVKNEDEFARAEQIIRDWKP
jgi:hypothetical protein